MTIELTTEKLTEVLEQAHKYGACVIEVKTPDDEEVWLAVTKPAPKQRGPRTPKANSEPAPPVQTGTSTTVTQ